MYYGYGNNWGIEELLIVRTQVSQLPKYKVPNHMPDRRKKKKDGEKMSWHLLQFATFEETGIDFRDMIFYVMKQHLPVKLPITAKDFERPNEKLYKTALLKQWYNAVVLNL